MEAQRIENEEATVEQRVEALEEAVVEMYNSLADASRAIQRLETFFFAVVKVGIDNGTWTHDHLLKLGMMLHEHEDILEFYKADVSDLEN